MVQAIKSSEIIKNTSGKLHMKIEYKGEVLLLDVTKKYKMNPNQAVIQAFTFNKEPYATLTKCLPETQLLKNETVLDEPSVPGILNVLVSSNIAEDTGQVVEMSFNSYPIVKVINSSYPS